MITPTSPKPMHFDGVQALRAFAVLLVIWTHLKYAGDFSGIDWIQSHAGGAGVDIFFVISGFVICASAESLRFSASRFFVNRFTRIAPLYWLSTLPLLLSILKNGRPVSAGSLVNSFLFLPVIDFGGMSAPINSMGWSLSFEFWFYILFSMALLVGRQQAWKMVLATLVVLSVVVGAVDYGAYFFPKFVANPLTLEFGAGIAIYKFREKIGRGTALVAVLGAIAMAVLGLQAGAEHAPFGDYMANYAAGLRRAATWGSLGVCLVVVVVHADMRLGIRWPAGALRLGDYSYSLYLIQPYGLWIATKLASRTSLPAWATGVSFVVSTLVLGALLSVTLEGRLTKWARRATRPILGRHDRALGAA